MVRLAAALSELNARLRGVDAEKLGVGPTDPKVREHGVFFTMVSDAGTLDSLNDVPGAEDYDHMRSRARQVDAGSVTVWVVGLDDLIRMKEASGREQDLLDIRKLREQQLSCEN